MTHNAIEPLSALSGTTGLLCLCVKFAYSGRIVCNLRIVFKVLNSKVEDDRIIPADTKVRLSPERNRSATAES